MSGSRWRLRLSSMRLLKVLTRRPNISLENCYRISTLPSEVKLSLHLPRKGLPFYPRYSTPWINGVETDTFLYLKLETENFLPFRAVK